LAKRKAAIVVTDESSGDKNERVNYPRPENCAVEQIYVSRKVK